MTLTNLRSLMRRLTPFGRVVGGGYLVLGLFAVAFIALRLRWPGVSIGGPRGRPKRPPRCGGREVSARTTPDFRLPGPPCYPIDPRSPREIRGRPRGRRRSVGRGCRSGYLSSSINAPGCRPPLTGAEGKIAGGANQRAVGVSCGPRTCACMEPPSGRTGRSHGGGSNRWLSTEPTDDWNQGALTQVSLAHGHLEVGWRSLVEFAPLIIGTTQAVVSVVASPVVRASPAARSLWSSKTRRPSASI